MMTSFLRRQGSWMIIGLVATLAVMAVVFSLASPYFFTPENFLVIGQTIAIEGLISIGETVIMIAGGLDLSIAAVAAVTGMLGATLILRGASGIEATLGALGAAAILGTVNSVVIVKFRINPIIATLGSLLLFRGLAEVAAAGNNVVIGTYTWAFLGRGYFVGLPIPVLIYLAALILAYFFLSYTVIGNYIYAVGGNHEACRNVGIKVDRLRFGLYILTAVFSGIAGLILMSQSGTAEPMALNGAELDILAAVLLGGIGLTGGRGSVIGTFFGTLVMGTVSDGLIMVGVPLYWSEVARGFILIFAVTLDSFRRGGGYR